MTDAVVLLRLRRFLLVVSALLLLGTLMELWLVGHTESFVQLIPFALSGLGLILATVVLLHERRSTLLALRVCALLLMLGSLFGVYEHIIGNIAFQTEVNPSAPAREVLVAAMSGGNPLLAPGILALAAVLAIAATYRHPALGKDDPADSPN